MDEGQCTLRIFSSGVLDKLRNPPDGDVDATFPSGNGQAGGDYDTVFYIDRTTAVPVVFTRALYETNQEATWRDGDINCDGRFNSRDLVLIWQYRAFDVLAASAAAISATSGYAAEAVAATLADNYAERSERRWGNGVEASSDQPRPTTMVLVERRIKL